MDGEYDYKKDKKKCIQKVTSSIYYNFSTAAVKILRTYLGEAYPDQPLLDHNSPSTVWSHIFVRQLISFLLQIKPLVKDLELKV